MQSLSVMLLATTATALVLPATPRMGMAVRARPVMQFDDEGGMIKEIEEGGMTLEQVKASYGASGPELPADKAARVVLKEAEWNVEKMAVETVSIGRICPRSPHRAAARAAPRPCATPPAWADRRGPDAIVPRRSRCRTPYRSRRRTWTTRSSARPWTTTR